MQFKTSWDDGHKLDMKVALLLQKYDLPGTFYIVVDWIDKPGYLTWQDVKDLDQEGYEIGSHTMTHPQDLKLLFDDELTYEVQTSKQMIETVLGHKIKSFCYPRGRYDQRVIDKVVEAGYVEARTTQVGVTQIPKDKFETGTTVHIYNRREYKGKNWFDYGMSIDFSNSQYYHIFAHSWEIDKYEDWEKTDIFFKRMRDLLNNF